MSFESIVSELVFETDGETTDFPLTNEVGALYFMQGADLRAAFTPSGGDAQALAFGSDFTVSGDGRTGTGVLGITPALASGGALRIWRATPIVQPEHYNENDGFPAKTHESAQDRGRLIDQDLARKLSRAVTVPDTEEPNNLVFPAEAVRAGKVAGYALDGQLAVAHSTLAQLDAALDALATGTVLPLSGAAAMVIGVAALKALAPAPIMAGARVNVFDYVAGDGVPPRQYRLVNVNPGADDGGAILASNTAGYWWVLVPSTVMDIRAFGAPADGTDASAAIAKAAAAFPGRLFVGGGKTYTVSSNLPAGFRMLDGMIVDTRTVTLQDDYGVVALGEGALSASTFIPEQFPASGDRFFAAGNDLVAIGYRAMGANTTGRRQVAIGSRSLLGNTTGYYNTAVGSHTMENNATGHENAAFGTQALQSCSNGYGNTGLGATAGNKIQSGTNNTCVGYLTGAGFSASVASGSGNTAVGYRALGVFTTAYDCVAIGRDACVSQVDGSENCVIGADAKLNNVSGNYNCVFGQNAGRESTGNGRSIFGAYALDALVDGQGGDAFGYQALTSATGDYNSAFGYQSGNLITTGSNNVVMGRAAGGSITTGSANTCLGYSADTASSATNSTALGNGATCTGSNQVTLGNNGVTTLRCQVTSITALSDERFKTDVRDLEIPDAFLEEIRIVVFRWTAEAHMPDGDQVSVLAQQLDAAQCKYGLEWLNLVDKTNPDRWEATPGKLLLPLLMKFGGMSKRMRAVESRLDALEAAE